MEFKILLIEDENFHAKQIIQALKLRPCEIVGIAKNATDAMELLDTQQPDFAIIDIHLFSDSALDGIDVAIHMIKTKRIPFVFLTEHTGSDSPYFIKAIRTLPLGYIPKKISDVETLSRDLWHYIDYAIQTENSTFRPITNKNEVFITSAGRIKFIRALNTKDDFEKIAIEQIVYLVAAEKYCKIYLRNKPNHLLIRVTLSETLKSLDCDFICRINGHIAINVLYIKYDLNTGIVTIDSSKVRDKINLDLEVTRTYRTVFEDRYFDYHG